MAIVAWHADRCYGGRSEGEYPNTELPPSRTAIGLGSPAPLSGRDLRENAEAFIERSAMRKVVLAHRLRRVATSTKRMLVIAVGFVVLGAGLMMLVLPGPGIVIVAAGLVILATELDWAGRVLDRIRDRAASATAQLQSRRTVQAALAVSACALITGGAAAAVIVDDHRSLGVAVLIAGLCSLAVLVPATQRWLNQPRTRRTPPTTIEPLPDLKPGSEQPIRREPTP